MRFSITTISLFLSSCSPQIPMIEQDAPATAPEPAPDSAASNIADSFDISQVQNASWLVIAVNSTSLVQGSSFAIGPNRLATNAHVVNGIAKILKTEGSEALAFQSGTLATLTIQRLWSHPEFDPTGFSSPDVGIIEVDGFLLDPLELADRSVYMSLGPLDPITSCGFPGDITELDLFGLLEGQMFQPIATCQSGEITAIRPPDGRIIQHNINTTGGSSGSPILNEEGRVIAIHYASTGENQLAIRGDELQELINLIDSNLITPLDLTPLPPSAQPCTVICDYCYQGTELENNCPVHWQNDGECDCGCQFGDPIDCGEVLALTNGRYEGSTSQDKEIQFRISNGRIVSVTLSWSGGLQECPLGNSSQCSSCAIPINGCVFEGSFSGVIFRGEGCENGVLFGSAAVTSCSPVVEFEWTATRS